MPKEDVLTVRLREEASSVPAVASVFRSFDLIVGAGAWLEISAKAATQTFAAHEAVLREARRHPTSRTGRLVLGAFGLRERDDPSQDVEGLSDAHDVDLSNYMRRDAWGIATDQSAVDWLRQELDSSMPGSYDGLTRWAQIETIRRESPTIMEILLGTGAGGGVAAIARYGPVYVITTMRTFIEGWYDIVEERQQHRHRRAVIEKRGAALLAQEEMKTEAAMLAAEACRAARLSIQPDLPSQDALDLVERIALPALTALATNDAVAEVSLTRHQR